MQQEDDQKCEKMKDEINGHCQEDGACSREDTQVVDKERLEKFFRSALDASRRYKKLAFFTSYGLGLQGYPDLS
jgi:hypothetical protein